MVTVNWVWWGFWGGETVAAGYGGWPELVASICGPYEMKGERRSSVTAPALLYLLHPCSRAHPCARGIPGGGLSWLLLFVVLAE